MDQEGENVEKPDEHQNQEGGEETKPDADMEIDQLFLNNGLRALYLCSDKLFFNCQGEISIDHYQFFD